MSELMGAIDLTGAWALRMIGPQGLVQMTLRLQQIDNDLRGTADGPMGSSAVNGTVEGEKVEFSLVIDSGPGFEMAFSGTHGSDEEGELIRGTMRSGDVTAEFSARRAPARPVPAARGQRLTV